MPASQPSPSAPSLARRDVLIERVEAAAGFAAHDPASRIALDESLQALRRECARTMSLVRRQRSTSVYRRVVYQAVRF